jgi:hypothetical protein
VEAVQGKEITMGFLVAQIGFILLNEMLAATLLLLSLLRGAYWMVAYMAVLLTLLGLAALVSIIDFIIREK